MKVIVVDDEPLMLKSFARISGSIEGLQLVGSFPDAYEALEFLENNTVDVACIDVSMPGMDGKQLAAEIRKKYPATRILFITAFDQQICDGEENERYILKPYNKETLSAAIRSTLALRP